MVVAPRHLSFLSLLLLFLFFISPEPKTLWRLPQTLHRSWMPSTFISCLLQLTGREREAKADATVCFAHHLSINRPKLIHLSIYSPVKNNRKRAPQEFKNAVDFLRAKAGPKVRLGILNGKRVEYFKGTYPLFNLYNVACEVLMVTTTTISNRQNGYSHIA